MVVIGCETRPFSVQRFCSKQQVIAHYISNWNTLFGNSERYRAIMKGIFIDRSSRDGVKQSLAYRDSYRELAEIVENEKMGNYNESNILDFL